MRTQGVRRICRHSLCAFSLKDQLVAIRIPHHKLFETGAGAIKLLLNGIRAFNLGPEALDVFDLKSDTAGPSPLRILTQGKAWTDLILEVRVGWCFSRPILAPPFFPSC